MAEIDEDCRIGEGEEEPERIIDKRAFLGWAGRAEWPTETVIEAIRGANQGSRANDGSDQQGKRHELHPLAGQPATDAQRLGQVAMGRV